MWRVRVPCLQLHGQCVARCPVEAWQNLPRSPPSNIMRWAGGMAGCFDFRSVRNVKLLHSQFGVVALPPILIPLLPAVRFCCWPAGPLTPRPPLPGPGSQVTILTNGLHTVACHPSIPGAATACSLPLFQPASLCSPAAPHGATSFVRGPMAQTILPSPAPARARRREERRR